MSFIILIAEMLEFQKLTAIQNKERHYRISSLKASTGNAELHVSLHVSTFTDTATGIKALRLAKHLKHFLKEIDTSVPYLPPEDK